MSDYKNDQRQKPRNSVNQKVIAINALNGDSLGTVVDIHSGGFLLLGVDSVVVNNVYQMELVFDAAIDSKTRLSLGAQCLWNRQAGVGGQSWLGFHIIDLSEEDEALVEKMSDQVQN